MKIGIIKFLVILICGTQLNGCRHKSSQIVKSPQNEELTTTSENPNTESRNELQSQVADKSVLPNKNHRCISSEGYDYQQGTVLNQFRIGDVVPGLGKNYPEWSAKVANTLIKKDWMLTAISFINKRNTLCFKKLPPKIATAGNSNQSLPAANMDTSDDSASTGTFRCISSVGYDSLDSKHKSEFKLNGSAFNLGEKLVEWHVTVADSLASDQWELVATSGNENLSVVMCFYRK